MNKEQLQKVRKSTLYPTYRLIVNVITVVGYILSGLTVFISMIAASMSENIMVFVIGTVIAIIASVLCKVWNEVMIMVIDFVDVSIMNAPVPADNAPKNLNESTNQES